MLDFRMSIATLCPFTATIALHFLNQLLLNTDHKCGAEIKPRLNYLLNSVQNQFVEKNRQNVVKSQRTIAFV